MATSKLTHGNLLALACMAGGMDAPRAAQSLNISESALKARLKEAADLYRKRGIRINSIIDTIRAAEAEGALVAPRRLRFPTEIGTP